MWTDGLTLVEVPRAEAWRAWLESHHARAAGAWLVFHKAHTGRPSPSYGEAVDEAVCFGWVDNLMRRIDDDRYARRFVPRKPDSKWSESNVQRVNRLLAEGRMAPAGLASVAEAKKRGTWPDTA